MSDLQKIAKRVESSGRGGDTTLLHVNKQELKTLESLLGEITTNPKTGLPEAFNWKALLTAITTAINPIAGIALGATFLATRKKSEPKASEAGQYLDERTAAKAKGHYDFAPPMTTLQSIQPPDVLGRQRNNFIAPMGTRNPLASIADNVDASTGYAKGGVVTEEAAKEKVLAMLAGLQAQQQGAVPMAAGRMVKGAGAGLDDLIPANLSDGEYVIPADAVSMMGDGSTDAGGRELDQLVAKVRMQKTGTRKQAGKMRMPTRMVRRG